MKIKNLIPQKVRRKLGARSSFCYESFAQEGEDRILSSLLGFPERTTPGFYVDVGAHHPERFSNTYLFYTLGWSGLNIDAMPGSMEPFKRERPRDINVEAAIANEAGSLTFYEFNEPAFNGFSREVAAVRDNYKTWKIIKERKIATVRLETLLAQHLKPGQKIDFISIDVEGLDLDVIKSNDWQKFRPAVALVEDSEAMLGEPGVDTEITRLMKKNDYVFACKTVLTTFFIDKQQVESTPVGLRLKLT